MLWRNPTVTATAVLSLAVGIGANTAVFTVANALLFRGPAGVAEADRLVDIGIARPDGGFNPTSFPTYADVRDRAAKPGRRVRASDVSPRDEPRDRGNWPSVLSRRAERVFGHSVTSNYFSVLGVRAAVGRVFDAAGDGRPGASPVAVLSHRFWARRFNGDASISRPGDPPERPDVHRDRDCARRDSRARA